MIATILLVPADNDPHGLLADGVCGAMVPQMWRWDDYPDRGPKWCPGAADAGDAGALVLAYQGKPVVEGCDRAARGLREPPIATDYTMVDALNVARRVQDCGAARLVLLDSDGREVTP